MKRFHPVISVHHLRSSPFASVTQSSEETPDAFGLTFSADIIKVNRQLIFTLREWVSSYTVTLLIQNVQRDTLRDTILRTCLQTRPINSPPAVVRTDSASGFKAHTSDKLLRHYNISIEIGSCKNPSSNHVVEKAVQDVEEEILKMDSAEGQVSSASLVIATNRLNARIRSCGLSPRKILYHRNQFTSECISFEDMDLIKLQHHKRLSSSEHCRAPNRSRRDCVDLRVGNIVYLHGDFTKIRSRERYLVSAIQDVWASVRKFAGSQLRAGTHKVCQEQCYKVPSQDDQKLGVTRDHSGGMMKTMIQSCPLPLVA
ncbi:unnamed protein product [Acanthosepion pharaonis]|uniref:Integrase catalytic domain-containing protein n=1 Tax=Acanthosepion pharaonis TaxID=158019 RepID=A0A812E4D8_ACAPH|nr:unnamed protein product [Sepia pharaonis]